MEMNEEKAREILRPSITSITEFELFIAGKDWKLDYTFSEPYAVVDGCLTADELESLAWWMRNKGKADGV